MTNYSELDQRFPKYFTRVKGYLEIVIWDKLQVWKPLINAMARAVMALIRGLLEINFEKVAD